jgi:hypothetical protein
MRWPWVSRGAYEALERERNALMSLLDQQIAMRQERDQKFHAFVDDLIQMKRDGFEAAPRYPEAEEVKEPDALILDALDAIGLKGSERAGMLTWAERQLAKGREAKEVAAQLRRGGLVDYEDVPV